MSDNLNSKKVVLFGCGKMGLEYSKVLTALGVDFSVVGRSQGGVDVFFQKTGIKAVSNGFNAWVKSNQSGATQAIVAVSVEELAQTAINLMDFGIKRILLEKPAGLNREEIRHVKDKAEETGTEITVAYNRRFYSSVLKAQEIIKADGGAKSFSFEFTEWLHLIPDHFKDIVKENWFLANSTHVVDLAFFLCGKPKNLKSYISQGPDCCYPAVFSGAGVTETKALFSYQANWFGPGRWGLEIVTKEHRIILRPLEKLQIQLNKSLAVDFIEIEDQFDRDFKPGLFKQTDYFLKKFNHPNFININEHYNNVINYFQKINGSKDFCVKKA